MCGLASDRGLCAATGVVREGDCHYQELSLRDFFDWMQGSAGNDGVPMGDAELAQCGGGPASGK